MAVESRVTQEEIKKEPEKPIDREKVERAGRERKRGRGCVGGGLVSHTLCSSSSSKPGFLPGRGFTCISLTRMFLSAADSERVVGDSSKCRALCKCGERRKAPRRDGPFTRANRGLHLEWRT